MLAIYDTNAMTMYRLKPRYSWNIDAVILKH